MRTRPLTLATALAFLGILPFGGAPSAGAKAAATSPGRVRTYYIAADEVDWTYAPDRRDLAITGLPFDLKNQPELRGMLDPNSTTYRKALFREYTDSSFATLKPRSPDWEHLGMLGPLIRAEVGDTIKVVFRNHASRPYSMHPHGVFYQKSAEGFRYQDGSIGRDTLDDSVAPGQTYTYIWTVPERAGPAPGEGSSVFWVYHSHVNEGRDMNAGLFGPMIITRRGMARPDGSPKDVDREFVAEFGLYDEPLSWYWDVNVLRLFGDSSRFDRSDPAVVDFQRFYTINGFMSGNGPLFTMHTGERVRWYLFANLNEQGGWDVHTPHWHGQTVVVNHMRSDMVMLTPMTSAIADMVPDNPGIWLFHCHMPGHVEAGMTSRFEVLP